MFNSMKNQIREKTGKELPKFMPQKGGLSRQSRQGSESSLSSLVLEPSAPMQGPSNSPATLPVQSQDVLKLSDGKILTSKEVNILSKKEEEWRHRLEKKEAEWSKKLEKKEGELQQELSKREEEWKKREQQLTEDLAKYSNDLRDALKTTEDYRKKICQYQEDKDQLEGFQTQEMAKIKHLLLAKEKESTEMATALKDSQALVDSLRSEVNRLRPLEEKISNYEVGRLSRQAGEEGAERRRVEGRVAELEAKLEEEAKEKEKLNLKASKLSEEVDSLASELKGANALIEKDRSTISELSRKLREAEENISISNMAKSRLEEELLSEKDLHSKSLEEVTSLKASYERDLLDTKKSLELANHELNKLSAKYNKANKEASDAQYQLTKYTDEVRELQHKLQLALHESKTIQDKLEEARKEVDKEKHSKEEALLRNAQVSQEVDIAKSELRHQTTEHEELFKRISTLEATILEKEQELKKAKEDYAELLGEMSALQTESETKHAAVQIEQNLREKIANLEQQVADRNKNIRVLQQKLSDMKKTLQRELKSSDPGGGDQQSMANNHYSNSNQTHVYAHNHQQANGDEEVNFLYLKHVIMKFLTSREYEVAQHLTRAVATLLKLTPEEECLLKDTLNWKMSWFASKPKPQDYVHS